MANPNLASLTSIVGVTTSISNLGIASTVLISNQIDSNKIYRVNSILASNSNTITSTITVKLTSQSAGAGSTFGIAVDASIPAKTTLVVVGKDSPIYVLENKSVIAIANTSIGIDVLASYDEIS